MNKQVINIGKTGSAISVSELAELLVDGLERGTFTGDEIMADFDNSDCCLMGLKKKGKIVMCDFESENEEYLSFLEREGYFNTDRCDPFDEFDETLDTLEKLEDSIKSIIETVENLEGEKHE